MKIACSTLALAFAIAACGGTVVSQTGSAGGTGASSTTTTTGAGGSGTGTSGTGNSDVAGAGPATTTSSSTGSSSSGSPCPAQQPQGGACSPEGFRCTYGDSVRADCRSSVTCSSGMWTGETSLCSMSTVCNQFKSPPAGQMCDPSTATFCVFDDTLCACGQCLEGPCMAGPATWQCSGPPTTPGCPAVLPNDGSPCSSPGVQCSYGYPCGGSGADVECQNGLWIWQSIGCPA